MGTVVTCCMFAGLVVAAPAPFINKTPRWFRLCIAYIVMAAGLWNVLWYGLQHLTRFWGWAALVSGTLMIVTALFIIGYRHLPRIIRSLKPVVLLSLFGCAVYYAITIIRL